jgi:hypothetical protein
MAAVRASLRFVAVALYAGYLVHVGLLLLLLPWSDAWSVLVFRFPPAVVPLLDTPAARGVLSGFGLLHLLLLAAELLLPDGLKRLL